MRLVWNPWTQFILIFTAAYAVVFLSHGGGELLDPLFWGGVGYLLCRTVWSWIGLPAFMLAGYHTAVFMQMSILGTVVGTALVFSGLLLVLKRRPAAVVLLWKKLVLRGRSLSGEDGGFAALFSVFKRELMHKLNGLKLSHKFGDLHLDLSKMLISEGEQQVVIGKWVGSISIYVPYDLEVSITCTTNVGTIDLFGARKKLRGQFLTPGYADTERKVMLIVATGIGDVTVRRL
ncbi:cell wall-active antibiotics response protein LiaF [Paenibacillus cremeus]|nr:cell wall-active antibiotics response protein LiaF [Paenibacillus cremeus]